MAVISIRVYQVPVSLQALYSLATRQTELEMRPAARHNELGILAWSPLASGFLTGKYERNKPRSPGARAGQDRPLYQYTSSNYETSDRTWAAVDAVRQVAVSDPNPNPYPYGPFGSTQRHRTANGPEAPGALVQAHAKGDHDGIHPAR